MNACRYKTVIMIENDNLEAVFVNDYLPAIEALNDFIAQVKRTSVNRAIIAVIPKTYKDEPPKKKNYQNQDQTNSDPADRRPWKEMS